MKLPYDTSKYCACCGDTHQQGQRDEYGDDEGGDVLVPEDVVRVGPELCDGELVGGPVDQADGTVLGGNLLLQVDSFALGGLEVQRAHERHRGL